MILKDTSVGRLIFENLSTEKTAGTKPAEKFCTEDVKKISNGLLKVANLPYKEEVYRSVQEMMKISSECINDLVSSLESAKTRNLDLEKAAEVRVVIDDMVKFGAVDENDLEEKIAELLEKDANQLSIIKEALKLVSNGKEGNVFFEIEKDAGTTDTKAGMFDSVVEAG